MAVSPDWSGASRLQSIYVCPSGSGQTKQHQRHLATFFDPSIYWLGLGKHLVDNAPSVDILRYSKNPVDAIY